MTWNNSHTYCKLDRAMVDDSWLFTLENSLAEFRVLGVSNSPIIFWLFQKLVTRKVPFKSKNFWVTDPNFQHLVDEAWQQEVFGCDIFRLV